MFLQFISVFSVLSRAALKVELGLERSYRRAPRGAADGKREDGMAGICHFCLAGMAGREWEDVWLESDQSMYHAWFCMNKICCILHIPPYAHIYIFVIDIYRVIYEFLIQGVLLVLDICWNMCCHHLTLRSKGEQLIHQSYIELLPEPWSEESIFTQRLLHQTGPQGKSRFFKIDIWHVVHMGVAKDFISSAMCYLQTLMEGSNIDSRFEYMTMLYKEFCASNKKIRYISKLSKDTFGGCGKRDEPSGGWNKAALSTTLMQFLAHLCTLYHDQCQMDEELRFVASCIHIVDFLCACFTNEHLWTFFV